MTQPFNRRNFLRVASGIGTALTTLRFGKTAATVVGAAVALESADAAVSPTGQLVQSFLLAVDGASGWLRSFAGGNLKAELAELAVPLVRVVKKHVANVTIEDIVVQGGVGLAPSILDWMKATV